MKLPLMFRFRFFRSLFASTVSLMVVWSACISFIMFDRENTEDVFKNRQHGIISYTADVLHDTKNITPIVLSTFESMLKKGTMDFFNPNENIIQTRNTDGLISYGNFIFSYNGDVKIVKGFLDKMYKQDRNKMIPLYPLEHKKIERVSINTPNSNNPHSDIITYNANKLIVTSMEIKLLKGSFVYTLYADYENVMEQLHFNRRKQFTILMSCVLSLIVFLFSAMVLKGLFREAFSFVKLQETTEELGEEISNRKKAEESPKKSEQSLRLAFENARDAIFWIEPSNGIIINCNKQTESLLGKNRGDISGCHFSILAPRGYEQEFVQLFSNHIESGTDLDTESEIVTTGEIITPILISSSTIQVGEKPVVQSIFRDITNLKKEIARNEHLKDQLMQSQKMEAVGTLAGGIAHDFNNLLAVIMGNTQLVANKLPIDNPLQQKLSRIVSSSLSAKDLTMKLLTFSRKDMLNIESVKPCVVVKEMVEMLERSVNKNIKIFATLPDSSCYISADFNQLMQALLNIGINAKDSMPDGGIIDISTHEPENISGVHAARLKIPDGNYCVIRIKDSGNGIAPEIMSKIFDPFFTTKDRGKGTGLGLSITRNIIEKLGGGIEVLSSIGEGVTFNIYLPVTCSPTTDSTKLQLTIPRGNGEYILLIDDDEMFVDMAEDLLQNWGYTVTTERSGNAAVKTFEEKSNTLSLVILDMIMPDQDGTEVFEKLKTMNVDIPILLCSGYSKDGNAEALMNQGAAAYIQKPFTAEELLGTVANLIQRKKGSSN